MSEKRVKIYPEKIKPICNEIHKKIFCSQEVLIKSIGKKEYIFLLRANLYRYYPSVNAPNILEKFIVFEKKFTDDGKEQGSFIDQLHGKCPAPLLNRLADIASDKFDEFIKQKEKVYGKIEVIQ
jgi:hypothetical protein